MLLFLEHQVGYQKSAESTSTFTNKVLSIHQGKIATAGVFMTKQVFLSPPGPMHGNAGAGAPPVLFFSALSFSSDFDRAKYGLSIHNG